MALGRIFGMMQRPAQPGDVEEYERCRLIALGDDEYPRDRSPCYARDHRKGTAPS